MIDKEKNRRLAYLLQQTDEYIDSLIKMVEQHKQELNKKKKRRKSSKKTASTEVGVGLHVLSKCLHVHVPLCKIWPLKSILGVLRTYLLACSVL